MKTETKNRLLGGYFKHTLYNLEGGTPLDDYNDNHGAHTANGSLSFDNSLNATNYVTLGTVGIGNNEYIGIRIEADAACVAI